MSLSSRANRSFQKGRIRSLPRSRPLGSFIMIATNGLLSSQQSAYNSASFGKSRLFHVFNQQPSYPLGCIVRKDLSRPKGGRKVQRVFLEEHRQVAPIECRICGEGDV